MVINKLIYWIVKQMTTFIRSMCVYVCVFNSWLTFFLTYRFKCVCECEMFYIFQKKIILMMINICQSINNRFDDDFIFFHFIYSIHTIVESFIIFKFLNCFLLSCLFFFLVLSWENNLQWSTMFCFVLFFSVVL